jgi:hypothetical protein
MENPMLAEVSHHNLETLKMALALHAQPLNVTHFPHNPPLPLGMAPQQAEEGPPPMMSPYPSQHPLYSHAMHPHHRHQAMVLLVGSPRLQQGEGDSNLSPSPEPPPRNPHPAPDPLPEKSPKDHKEVLPTLPTHPTRDETGGPPNGTPPFMPGPTPPDVPPSMPLSAVTPNKPPMLVIMG